MGDDAYAVADSGAHFLLMEAVPPELGHFVCSQLDIPVYGIGGGWAVDGQLLIIADLIGEFQAFTPKFVKKDEMEGVTALFKKIAKKPDKITDCPAPGP